MKRQDETFMLPGFAIPILSTLQSVYAPLGYRSGIRSEREKALQQFLEENRPDGMASNDFPGIIQKSHEAYLRFNRLAFRLILIALSGDTRRLVKLAGTIHAEGLELFDSYSGKGFIGIGFHIGPFPLIPALLAFHGRNTSFLARGDMIGEHTSHSVKSINGKLDKLFRDKGHAGLSFVDSQSKLSLVQIKKAYAKGNAVFVFPDTARDSSVSSVPVPFFRQQIAGHEGLGKLVKLTGADVLLFSLRWVGDHAELNITRLLADTNGISSEDIVRTVYGAFEAAVAETPEQWIQVQTYPLLKTEPCLHA